MKVLQFGTTKEEAYKWTTQANCTECGAVLEVGFGDLTPHDFYSGKLRFDCGFCGKKQKAAEVPTVITDLILAAAKRR